MKRLPLGIVVGPLSGPLIGPLIGPIIGTALVVLLLAGCRYAPTPTTAGDANAPLVQLVQAGIPQLPAAARRIGVDANRADIPVAEILSGGPPPQGIPALGFGGDWRGGIPASPAPRHVTQEAADAWLDAAEPVIAVSVGGEARAYPLQVLTWHEIANDTLGGVPIAVTFCPLCNSALAFDRRVPLTPEALEDVRALNPDAAPGEFDPAFLEAYARQQGDRDGLDELAALEVTFGVSGTLYNSNLLMFDSHASTLWSQLLGAGNVGTLTGTALLRIPAQIVAWAEFKEAFPDADVLSRDTGFNRRYGQNPYVGYDRADSPAFLFSGITDGRLPPKARVVSVERGGEAVAYPFEVLRDARVVNDRIADEAVAVWWQPGTASALDRATIAGSEDVGAVGVFQRELDGRTLTFRWDDGAFVDEETGSQWNLLGRAVAGELAGVQLTPVVHDNTLWFAWAAFKPDTRIYTRN